MNIHLFPATLVLALAMATGGALAQQVIKLTVSSGHPPQFLWVKMLDEVLLPEVDRRLAAGGGKYRIEWNRAYGGTLLKLGSESRGIADGVADLGMVSTLFEAPDFPLQNITYYAPFGSDDPELVSTTIAELQQIIPAMGDSWGKKGLIYLSGMALDSYHLWSTFPLTRIEDLRGKKISAPGPAASWINGTGAVAVGGSLNSYYKDIESGNSDGAVVFTTGAWSAKLHEVAPYITKVNFGSMFAGGVAVSKRKFERLPRDVQTAIREASDAWAAQYAQAQSAMVETELRKMVEAGAQVHEFSDAERKRWADALPPVARSWTEQTQASGLPARAVLSAYMASLIDAGEKLPRDWRE